MALGEFDIIRKYFSRESTVNGVILGVGDDGAILRPEDGRDLVSVVDSMVEDVHFPCGLSPSAIGFRAVAVNLSDIAAMGARPRWATLALTLPRVDEGWLEGFAGGLYEALEEAGVALVGGDTTRGDRIVISVQLIGDVERGSALRRDGARPGDDIYVSGTVGDAAAGLRQLQAGHEAGPLVARFRRPAARLALGSKLCGTATAAIDVSDGLLDDLGKLLSASGAGATLCLDAVPVSDELRGAFPEDVESLALGGGDDYELCVTVRSGSEGHMENMARDIGLRLTRIGRVEASEGIRCLREGSEVSVARPGYDHFDERLR